MYQNCLSPENTDVKDRPSKRIKASDSLMTQIGKHLDIVGKALSEPPPPSPSTVDPFVGYFTKVISDVPAEQKRKCEQNLLLVAHAYAFADGYGDSLQIMYGQ